MDTDSTIRAVLTAAGTLSSDNVPPPPAQSVAGLIALFVLFVVCGAYFGGSESAFSAMNKIRVKAKADDGDRRAKNALSVFHYLEANPIIDIRKTAEATGLSFNTVAAAIRKLSDMKILVQTNATSRNRTFAYAEYLDLLRDGT